MINLTGYKKIKSIPNGYGKDDKFPLQVGDIIKSRPDCTCDMQDFIVEVIKVNYPQNENGYVTKVLEYSPREGFLDIKKIWDMTYMKNLIHSGCDIYRKSKVTNWRGVIENENRR